MNCTLSKLLKSGFVSEVTQLFNISRQMLKTKSKIKYFIIFAIKFCFLLFQPIKYPSGQE